MEDECSLLNNSFYYLDEGIEEYLKNSLLCTTLELENTISSAREELARKDEELMHLKILLLNTTKERDEAISQCERLILENMLPQQQSFPNESPLSNGSFSFEEDETPPSTHCSSDSDENAVSTTPWRPIKDDLMEKIEPRKPLPEKGKFLQAVMEAGPLLQTLLVAGPLPQWQHPPPHLSSIDIPPVTLSSPSPRVLVQDTSPVSALPSPAVASTSRGCDRICRPIFGYRMSHSDETTSFC